MNSREPIIAVLIAGTMVGSLVLWIVYRAWSAVAGPRQRAKERLNEALRQAELARQAASIAPPRTLPPTTAATPDIPTSAFLELDRGVVEVRCPRCGGSSLRDGETCRRCGDG